MCTTRKSGFTLGELLVVLAIITCIVLLAVPVIRSARRQANELRCVSNLRQLSNAILMFVAEHKGKLPPIAEHFPGPVYGADVPVWGPTWAEYILSKYLAGERKLLYCPDRPDFRGVPGGYYTDYAYNGELAPYDDETGLSDCLSLTSVNNPSRKILLADAGRLVGAVMVGGFYVMHDAVWLHPRHAGSTVYVSYLDAHIEKHTYIQTGASPPHDAPLGYNKFDPYY